MRHLKTYKLFESIIDSEDSAMTKDILADLIDSNFKIDIVANTHNFTVRISKVDEKDYEDPNDYLEEREFTYNRVKADVDELISQLSDKYPTYTIYLTSSCPSSYDEYGDPDFQKMDNFINMYSLDEISMVQINFHKTRFNEDYSYEEEEKIESDVMDILQDISDDYDVEIEYHESSDFWINSLNKDVTAIRITIDFTTLDSNGISFSFIKSNIDHLVSYMKSIGYSNFIYRDDSLNFNLYSKNFNGGVYFKNTQKQNYLPGDDGNEGFIEHGVFTFIKD